MSSFGLPQWMQAPQPGEAGLPSQLTLAQIQQLGGQAVAQPMPQPAVMTVQPAQQLSLPNPDGTQMGTAPAAMPGGINPITGLPPGGATFETALGQYQDAGQRSQVANTAMMAGIDHERLGLQHQGEAMQQANDVQAQKAEQMVPIDAQREVDADSYQTRYDQLMAESEKANNIQLQRMQQAVQQASETQIHDFWADKSTGAKVLGIIAQALSGAANGLAGNPSAPTALDRIINDDLQRQMANQQNKTKTAQQEQGVYQMMLQATGDRRDALIGSQQAANIRTAAMANSLADRMAAPEAAARAKQIAADMEQKNAQLEEKRAEIYQQQASTDANAALAGIYNAESLMARTGDGAGGKGGAGGGEYYPLPGTVQGLDKAKTTSAIYNKQSKAASDVVGYMGTLQHALDELNGPGGLDSFYKFGVDHDLAFAKGRSDAMLGLGKRLEGNEQTMADRMAPGYLKSYIGGDITKARTALTTLQDAWGRALLESYRSANPQMQLDYNAPTVGPIFQRIATQDAAYKARAQGGANGQPAAAGQ